MKKLLMLLAIMLVLVMAACGQTEEDADNVNGGDTNAGEMDETALKSSVLTNYLDVTKSLRNNHMAIDAYLAELDNEEAEAATLETLKTDAIAAAEEATTTIDSFTLENLDEDTTAKFEEALVDLKAAYEEYATALAADEVDVTAAEAKITSTNDKLTALFEEVGLRAPDLTTELN